MGFNIEEYEMGDFYSNVSGNDALRGAGTICVKGNPIYLPPIYAGLQITKKGREKISENRQICQARYATKSGGSSVDTTSTTTPDTASNLAQSVTAPAGTSPTATSPTATSSNTGLYIGIGIGILAIGIVAIVLIKRRK